MKISEYVKRNNISYCARIYGLKRTKRKTEQIIKDSELDNETN